MDWRTKSRNYKLYAIEDGKGGVYVGSTTKGLEERLRQQKYSARTVGSTIPLFKAMNEGNSGDFQIRELGSVRGDYHQAKAAENVWKEKLGASLNGLIPGSEAAEKLQ